jgi:hypothetical protein
VSTTVNKDVPVQVTLGTTLTRLVPGDGVRQIQVSSPDGPFYLVLDSTLDQGGAVPATARHKYPAGVWPILVGPTRILLAGVNGAAPVVTILGGALGQFGGSGASSSSAFDIGKTVAIQRGLFWG